MVKLTETKYWPHNVLYFHNMRDCKKYLAVFTNHWCNVPWDDPIVIPDNTLITSEQRAAMDKSPRKRAKADLSWGFSMCRSNKIPLTAKQQKILDKCVEDTCIQ